MKTVNVVFTDEEYKVIIKAKEIHGGNWHDLLMDLARKYSYGRLKDNEDQTF